jgi:hypothetical protein
VDELADRVRPDDPQEPGDQQNDGDGIQHGDLSLFTPSSLRARQLAEALHASTNFSMRQSPEDVCAFEYMQLTRHDCMSFEHNRHVAF